MHTRERTTDGHTTRFTVVPRATGWEVCEELDSRLVRRVQLSDWHRVERALRAFETAAGGEPPASASRTGAE